MKSEETGVLKKSDLYFSSPSPTAKKLYFYPTSAGHFYCENNYRLVRKNYNSLLVTHIIDGSFTFLLEGQSVTAKKGETVILNCFKPHEYYTEDHMESIWVHFSGPNCVEWYQQIVQSNGNLITSGDSERIQKILFRLFDGISTDNRPSEAEMSLELYKLMTALVSPAQIAHKNAPDYEENIQEAKKYVLNHLTEKIAVGDIAASVHMSASHFSRIFKQQTGFSPYDFVLVSRLNRAKDYLQKTNRTVSEIAYEVGFNSESHFIYFFTSNVGISPRKFRKLKF